MKSALYWLACILCLTALFGCGESKAVVRGKVTFDGEIVKTGSITFIKVEGDPVRAGDVLRDGIYEVSLPPGNYKVEIFANRVLGKKKIRYMDKEDEVEETEPLIPDWYNSKTKLTAEVKPGVTPLDFELSSKP